MERKYCSFIRSSVFERAQNGDKIRSALFEQFFFCSHAADFLILVGILLSFWDNLEILNVLDILWQDIMVSRVDCKRLTYSFPSIHFASRLIHPSPLFSLFHINPLILSPHASPLHLISPVIQQTWYPTLPCTRQAQPQAHHACVPTSYSNAILPNPHLVVWI